MTIIPKRKTPTSGLVYSGGVWRATYTRPNGKRTATSLKTQNKAVATRLAGEFYDRMVEQGAVESGDPRTRKAPAPGSSRFIYYVKPWIFRVRGRNVGTYDTREQAEAARDAHFGIGEDGVV